MTKIRINKIDTARRQIDAAIRMTFGEEDPVAIHLVATAAHRIVRDICNRRGDIESYLQFTYCIAPGHEKEFWKCFNASANFLKHADEDADHILELDDEAADFLIVITSKWYKDLGNSLSPEMRTFAGWWTTQYPNMLKPDALAATGVIVQFAAAAAAINQLSRQDRLKAGLIVLRQIEKP